MPMQELWLLLMALCTCRLTVIAMLNVRTVVILHSGSFHFAWKQQSCISSLRARIRITFVSIPLSCHGLLLWYTARRVLKLKLQKIVLQMMVLWAKKNLVLSLSQHCNL